MKHKIVCVAVAVLLLLGPVVSADRTVIQKTVVAENILRVVLQDEQDDQGNVALIAYATYVIVDSIGKQVGHHRVVKIALNQAQTTAIRTFILNTVVPQANAQEGM